jgi:hypothetical protein
MKSLRGVRTSIVLGASAILACAALASGAEPRSAASGWAVHDLTLAEARPLAGEPVASRASRTAATWCGTAVQADLAPNAVAGNPVHWIYAIPSDGPDRLSTFASAMQTDAESIDAWWRASDPTRTLRSDLAPMSCGTQLDITTYRLSRSGAQLASIDVRFGAIADELISREFDSEATKYLVYYDGPVEPDICGQGGGPPSRLGFAMVYVQACAGVPYSTTAAHEVLHTMGAVPNGAPGMCAEPDDGHVCDDSFDMMYPFGDETPITGLRLDTGRNDYYGHSGSWLDTQDSPWLVQLDRQAPLTVTITGPGSISADVPGMQCGQTCTTTWNAGTELALQAAPASGAKLVRWSEGCRGAGGCDVVVGQAPRVSALFGPSAYRLTVAVQGKGSVRSSPAGVTCDARCSRPVPSYRVLSLTPRPAKGWRFRSWAGACRGTAAVCRVPMTANTSVRAVFVRK